MLYTLLLVVHPTVSCVSVHTKFTCLVLPQLPLEASAAFSRPPQKGRPSSASLGSGSGLHDTGSLLVPERLSWDVMQRGRDSKHNMTEAGMAAFKVTV